MTMTDHTNIEVSHHQESKKNKRNVIILNNGSSLSLFCNPGLVHDIKPSHKRMILAMNAGSKQHSTKATVPGFGEVWFDPEAIANIFGFAEMRKKHQITYDSDKEDAFLVYTENGIIKFKVTQEGLYEYEVTKEYLKNLQDSKVHQEKSHLVTSVTENMVGYTDQQPKRAKRV